MVPLRGGFARLARSGGVAMSAMRWLVGVDLDGRSAGALQMAAWLSTQPSRDGLELVAVHVIDARMLGAVGGAGRLRSAAERVLHGLIARSALSDVIADARVITAATVEDGLAEAAAPCDGLLIGRAAPRQGHPWVRLGSVARRMLRRLPLPVMVVPPDLSASEVGGGAVVLGADLGPSSVAAARLSRRIATDLARALVVVHIEPTYGIVPDYFGGGAVVIPQQSRRTVTDIETWAHACELGTVQTRLADGPVSEGLVGEALRESAPVVVVGSRRLSALERVFSSSVGSDVARLADRAVLVVPGDSV